MHLGDVSKIGVLLFIKPNKLPIEQCIDILCTSGLSIFAKLADMIWRATDSWRAYYGNT
jgi:hypothetical protein